MTRLIYIVVFSIVGITNLQAQDPGFGDEGGGDAQDAPTATIDFILIPLFVSGVVFYFYAKRNK